MSSETPQEPPAPPPRGVARTILRIGPPLVLVAIAVGLAWRYGGRMWTEYRDYREAQREAEDSAPIGYIGTAFRRSYNYRPAEFLREENGRKYLFAIIDDGKTEYYDVTDAEMNVASLSGGFGRDSNPGIDYPILEPSNSERGRRLRSRQAMYARTFGNSPRAYPADLLRRVEVVNEKAGDEAFVIVFDRSLDKALFYDRRLKDREITFGTTGYAHASDDPVKGTPLLYDRSTRGLWLPRADGLVCVNGELKGTKLAVMKNPPTATTWSDWKASHPNTVILMGNDRSKPIPSE